MPAAATSVHPADAVDSEFFDLDLLQDARFFLAGFLTELVLFVFHDISPFAMKYPHSSEWVVRHFNLQQGCQFKTLVYPPIYGPIQKASPQGPLFCVEKRDTSRRPDDFTRRCLCGLTPHCGSCLHNFKPMFDNMAHRCRNKRCILSRTPRTAPESALGQQGISRSGPYRNGKRDEAP